MQLLDKKWSKDPIQRIVNTISSITQDNIDNFNIQAHNKDIYVPANNSLQNINTLEELILYTKNLDHLLSSEIVMYNGSGKYCIIHEYYKRNNMNNDKKLIEKILLKYSEKIHIDDICHIYFIPFNCPSNYYISEKDILIFTPILHKFLELLNPMVILSLGNVVTRNLFHHEKINITSMRGLQKNLHINNHDIPTIITLHPMSVLKNKEYLSVFSEDIQSFIKICNES